MTFFLFFFFKSISWMGIATAEKSWTIGIVGCAEDRENCKFIYNPLSIFFFDVIGITLTHLLVFKHRLGALDILKEKNSAEAFPICNIHLYPLKWKKGDADLIH